ncbi:MAG: hypothetical protein R6U50_08545 [Desulfobacterales bacterium]
MQAVFDTNGPPNPVFAQIAFEGYFFFRVEFSARGIEGARFQATFTTDALLAVNIPGPGLGINTQGLVLQRAGIIAGRIKTLPARVELKMFGKMIFDNIQAGKSFPGHTVMIKRAHHLAYLASGANVFIPHNHTGSDGPFLRPFNVSMVLGRR